MADKAKNILGNPPSIPDEDIAAPDQKAIERFESRETYKGFKIPRMNPNTGKPMTMPERRAFRKAIDEREAFAPSFQRKFPRVADDIIGDTFRGVKRSAKDSAREMFKEAEGLKKVPGLAADVGEGLFEAATIVPRTKAAIAADPEGAKQFARAVMSGDREAIRSMATEASEGVAEPFATFGDAVLSADALERGEPLEAAGYAGLVLAPSVLQLLGKNISKGWLKSAAEAGEEIPDEAARKMNDLAKRVDEGKVTDDMQVRREIAAIEDTHKAEYMQSKPSGGERKSAFEPFPEYVPSPTGITSDQSKRNIEDVVSKVRETSERVMGKPPGGGGRSIEERLASEGIPVRMPAGVARPQSTDALMRNAINNFDMFGSGLGGPTKLYRVGQPNFPEGFSYMEASSPEALEQILLTNGELFEEFIDMGGLAEATEGGVRRDISDFISEASPEESAKYFGMKGGGGGYPGGGGGVAEFRAMQEGIRSFLKSSDPDALIRPNPSPKFGLSDQGHHNVVEDLGPLLPQDRNLLEEFAGKYNLSETELRQLRDEYVAYGYDDFPSRSQRGFEEIDIPDDRSRGGRSIDDIEGPSEAEIEEMIGKDFREDMQEDAKRRNFEQFGLEAVKNDPTGRLARRRRQRMKGTERDRPRGGARRRDGLDDDN